MAYASPLHIRNRKDGKTRFGKTKKISINIKENIRADRCHSNNIGGLLYIH